MSDPVAPGAGVELAYRELGRGPVVVLIHGMAADAEAWAPVMERVAGRARVIAYDRRGYGASQAPESYRRTTVSEQAQDAAALLGGMGLGPVVLGGADLGAVICLELALHHGVALDGLVLVEPAVLALVPEATEALSAQRAALEEALRDRGAGGAVDVWLDGWAQGPGLGVPGDPGRRARARSAPGAFFADYAGLASWSVRRRELRELAVPTRVVDGPDTPGYLAAAGAAVTALIPGAQRRSDGDVAAAVLELVPS